MIATPNAILELSDLVAAHSNNFPDLDHLANRLNRRRNNLLANPIAHLILLPLLLAARLNLSMRPLQHERKVQRRRIVCVRRDDVTHLLARLRDVEVDLTHPPLPYKPQTRKNTQKHRPTKNPVFGKPPPE